jgi:hypothetical protein
MTHEAIVERLNVPPHVLLILLVGDLVYAALASFRRLSNAVINAAGVTRCAIERNRVVLSALASSDNRFSCVDMVLDL